MSSRSRNSLMMAAAIAALVAAFAAAGTFESSLALAAPSPAAVEAPESQPAGTPAAGPGFASRDMLSIQMVAPAAIDSSIEAAPDQAVNSGRGAYRWYGKEPEPAGYPAPDGYMRYSWRTFEPTEGNYRFDLIDSQLSAAASRGGVFGLRIMPASSWDGGNAMPDYLVARMEKGFIFASPDNGKPMYAPDWNDPDYMARAEAMIRAIGQRYASDPRFGWIEIGPYGDYGEWHTWRWPYPSPTGAEEMTLANRQRLIDLHFELFPASKLYQMIDSATGTNRTIGYALGKSPDVGIRSDCFGTDLFDMRMKEVASAGHGDRWKTAPVLIEYCGAKTGSGQLGLGREQVLRGHVSLVEGNHGSYASYSAQEREDFDQTRRLSGYRYRLGSLSLPKEIPAGGSFTVDVSWINEGVAPAYRDWGVFLQLRDRASGQVVWWERSALDLQTVLPASESGGPVSISETYTLWPWTPPGNHLLEVIVEDPAAYLRPMALSMDGRGGEGGYALTTVGVY